MTQIQDKASKDRVIPILPEELEEFEHEVKRFQAGEWNTEHEFMAFRLRQGVYGQRQPDVQMVRVKAPFGGLTADQLDAFYCIRLGKTNDQPLCTQCCHRLS